MNITPEKRNNGEVRHNLLDLDLKACIDCVPGDNVLYSSSHKYRPSATQRHALKTVCPKPVWLS